MMSSDQDTVSTWSKAADVTCGRECRHFPLPPQKQFLSPEAAAPSECQCQTMPEALRGRISRAQLEGPERLLVHLGLREIGGQGSPSHCMIMTGNFPLSRHYLCADLKLPQLITLLAVGMKWLLFQLREVQIGTLGFQSYLWIFPMGNAWEASAKEPANAGWLELFYPAVSASCSESHHVMHTTWTLAVSSMGQAGKGFKDFSSPEDISRTSAEKNGEIYPNFAESVHQQRPEELFPEQCCWLQLSSCIFGTVLHEVLWNDPDFGNQQHFPVKAKDSNPQHYTAQPIHVEFLLRKKRYFSHLCSYHMPNNKALMEAVEVGAICPKYTRQQMLSQGNKFFQLLIVFQFHRNILLFHYACQSLAMVRQQHAKITIFPGAGRPAPPTLSGHIGIPAKVQQDDSSGLLSLAPLDPTEDLSAPSQDGDVEKQGHTQKGNERPLGNLHFSAACLHFMEHGQLAGTAPTTQWPAYRRHQPWTHPHHAYHLHQEALWCLRVRTNSVMVARSAPCHSALFQTFWQLLSSQQTQVSDVPENGMTLPPVNPCGQVGRKLVSTGQDRQMTVFSQVPFSWGALLSIPPGHGIRVNFAALNPSATGTKTPDMFLKLHFRNRQQQQGKNCSPAVKVANEKIKIQN
ncbi:hypothetical protein Anapl_14390 [Anas platyrhynchos]|uniref:Uncharacterized protein n=1 Tax=Anas platyrhynchos TaxID=8839 RepID=R0JXH9_ANAPL|nr:hypothetical protein Anapl_14390 [Anas platyrhynchos]